MDASLLQPSAISTLLQGLLAPPQPPTDPNGMPPMAPPIPSNPMGGMPGPQASPMPTVNAPPQPKSIFGRVLDSVKNFGSPDNASAGYEGLLSPDEIQNAKPGFLARLSSITPGAATPGEQYTSNLDHIVKLKQLASGIAEHTRVMQARREMATRFPLPDNPSIEDIRTNLAKQYAWAMSHGDEETMKDVGSRLSTIFTVPKPEQSKVVAPGGALVDSNGKLLYTAPAAAKAPPMGSQEWKDAEEFKAKLAAKYRVEPTQIIQGQTDDGQMHFYRVPKEGGPPVMIEGMSPKVTLKTENAQQELTRARAEAAVSEMNNGVKVMHDFEQKLKTNPGLIGNAGQILGSIANTFTHDDPASKIIQNTALSALNKTNPDLARYIRRALSFAEGESMISSRPSDFRTRMSAFLSAAANGATPDMIDDIESRRNAVLDPLNRIYAQKSAPKAAAPAAPSGTASTKRAITRDQADFLKTKKGMTDADIAQRYVVKP